MKKLLIVVAVIVAVLVGVVAVFYSNLDEIVRSAVEKAGSRVTQVEVTLDKVDLDPVSGKAALNALQVGNPEGFKSDYAFNLSGISVQADVESFSGDVITVNEVVVDGPKVIYELAGAGSNISVIQDNVNNFVNSVAGSGGEGEAASDTGGEGPKVVIENLYVRGGEVSVSAGMLEGKKVGVALPDLHLKDIGKESGGATPGEVAATVLSAINAAVIKAVASLDIDGLLKGAGDVMKDAGSVLEDVGGSAGEGVGKALEGVFGSD